MDAGFDLDIEFYQSPSSNNRLYITIILIIKYTYLFFSLSSTLVPRQIPCIARSGPMGHTLAKVRKMSTLDTHNFVEFITMLH